MDGMLGKYQCFLYVPICIPHSMLGAPQMLSLTYISIVTLSLLSDVINAIENTPAQSMPLPVQDGLVRNGSIAWGPVLLSTTFLRTAHQNTH